MWTALAAFAGAGLGVILVAAWIAALAADEQAGDDFLTREDDWGM
ncbi:hypothetical protein [Nitratireductor pacificus]|nr:hypothetical protein [Nitratireductor pacificus]